MRYLYFVILFFCVFLFSSCTYHFKLDDIIESPKLVLYCYPGSGDTTIVHLSRSLPVSQKGELSQGLKAANVLISVNDETMHFSWTNDSIPGIPAQSYYVVKKYKDGDKINITASADGMKTVSAATIIPKPFPLKSVDLIRKETDMDKLQFQIHFDDDASTKDYYAMRIEYKQMYWSNGNYSESISPIVFDLDDEPLLNNSSGLDDILMNENDFYKNLYYWDDTKIQGKSYTFRLNTYYMADYEDDFITPDGYEHIVCKTKYRVILYSLSEEFYKFLKSLNEQKNNGLGHSELAPIRATYTNVINGIGVVGGCRILRTQWIDNLKDD